MQPRSLCAGGESLHQESEGETPLNCAARDATLSWNATTTDTAFTIPRAGPQGQMQPLARCPALHPARAGHCRPQLTRLRTGQGGQAFSIPHFLHNFNSAVAARGSTCTLNHPLRRRNEQSRFHISRQAFGSRGVSNQHCSLVSSLGASDFIPSVATILRPPEIIPLFVVLPAEFEFPTN